jgi:hypothetical protein
VTSLPDCRAYELVSPPEKDGGDVMANSARTHAAADGQAVMFSSLAGFGDVAGTGVATEYLSERSTLSSPATNGWATHAVTPAQSPLPYLAVALGLDPLYEGEPSADLTHAVFRAFSPLSPAPNVATVENLYLRTNLRSSGAGSYRLLSNAIAPVGSLESPFANIGKPWLAGTSADLGHVLFESPYSLTAEATEGGPWLYEWDHGTLRVAGVLPNGATLSDAFAGQGAAREVYTPHTISADGLRIFFTDPSTGLQGNDGTLYMRETNPVTEIRTTVQLNATERTDCADHDPCTGAAEPDPGGAKPATYWDASADGGRVFFTSQEALTDDAPLDGRFNLYMYDTSKSAADSHNLTFLSVDNHPADTGTADGTIGISDDGRYVYLAAAGQLVANAPTLGTDAGIYVWHDGALAYVGELKEAGDRTRDLLHDWVLDPAQARVTPDGRQLLFMARSGVGLTGYDHGTCSGSGTTSAPCAELYAYSADSGQLRCVSCNPTGAAAIADAQVDIRTKTSASGTTWSRNRAVSDNGRYVFFNTAEALVPEDTNGRGDAYQYDVASGRVHLLSSGKDPSDSYFLTSGASGDDAFIMTRQRLVGWDTDSAYDLYDVRVGGGFPDPTPVPPSCTGDACHGAPGGAPAPSTPTSVFLSGARTPPPVASSRPAPKSGPPTCRRGFVRKRVKGKLRCVRGAHRATVHVTAQRMAR